MDPKTVQLVVFIEQMIGLATKTIVELKGVIAGSNQKSVDEILDDADANYQAIIDAR